MYNVTYKVPSKEKTDWAMFAVFVVATVFMCFAFARAVEGHGHRVQTKTEVTKHLKG